MSESRYEKVCAALEAAHREDPRLVEVDGAELAYSVHYHRRMGHWLATLEPQASEVLQVAVRAQHIRRWTQPRDGYPLGRAGYKQWRSALMRFHADQAGALMRAAGYDEASVERVGELLRKRRLRSDPDVQLLEDVVCLVFLELEFAEFSTQHAPDKLIDIVRKTWAKMTPRGHGAALELVDQLPDGPRELLLRALDRG